MYKGCVVLIRADNHRSVDLLEDVDIVSEVVPVLFDYEAIALESDAVRKRTRDLEARVYTTHIEVVYLREDEEV